MRPHILKTDNEKIREIIIENILFEDWNTIPNLLDNIFFKIVDLIENNVDSLPRVERNRYISELKNEFQDYLKDVSSGIEIVMEIIGAVLDFLIIHSEYTINPVIKKELLCKLELLSNFVNEEKIGILIVDEATNEFIIGIRIKELLPYIEESKDFSDFSKNILGYSNIDAAKNNSFKIECYSDNLSFFKDYKILDYTIVDIWKELLERLINYDYITRIQDNHVKGFQSSLKPMLTYCWKGNAEKELPLLFESFKEYISQENTLEQFTAIFTGQPIESITPIKWVDSNRLLAYFLDTAFSGQNWQSIAGNGKLFLNKKGKTITANDLATAKNGFNYGHPKGYEKIDRILKEILNINIIKTS